MIIQIVSRDSHLRCSSRIFFEYPTEKRNSISRIRKRFKKLNFFSRHSTLFIINVEITRFELVTPCLQGRCSPN